MLYDVNEYFNSPIVDIADKMLRFSQLELESNHAGQALDKLLLEENISVPNWCAVLIIVGFQKIRKSSLEALYREDPKQLLLTDLL